jgi:hypothetical protein
MSLTIQKIGNEIVCETLTIRATTDNVNVKSVQMEVYVHGFGLIATLEHSPTPEDALIFEFEVNSILRNYTVFALKSFSNGTADSLNVLATFAFKEVISNVVQATPYYTNANVKNFALDVFESNDFTSISNYITRFELGDASNSNGRFLTSSPLERNIYLKRWLHVSALTASFSGSSAKQQYVVELYLNNVLQTTFYYDVLPTSRTPLTSGAAGFYDISSLRFQAVSCDKLVVFVRDKASPNTVRSKTYTFNVVNPDGCRLGTLTFNWVNEFGVQESYTLAGNVNRTLKVKSISFRNTNDEDVNFDNDFNYSYEVFSDRMPQSDVQWLNRMFRSSRIWVEKEEPFASGDFIDNSPRNYPIIVKDIEVLDYDYLNPNTLLRFKYEMARERRGLRW